MSEEKWIDVTSVEQLKPGTRVRYKDCGYNGWIGGDGDIRTVNAEGKVTDKSGSFVWDAQELIDTWDRVQILNEEEPFVFDPDKRIDPDEPTNGERADKAACALEAFVSQGSCEPDEADIRDLIADLLHLCDRQGIDAEAQLASARSNWQLQR